MLSRNHQRVLVMCCQTAVSRANRPAIVINPDVLLEGVKGQARDTPNHSQSFQVGGGFDGHQSLNSFLVPRARFNPTGFQPVSFSGPI